MREMLALLSLALVACAEPARPSISIVPSAPPVVIAPPSRARVVFVTLDGVRAEDVFGTDDVMPRTHALVAAHGVALGSDAPGCGTVRTGTGVNVSLPGYLTMFSGQPTTCINNRCQSVLMPTVLDEAAAAGLRTASIGSWEVLERAVSNGTSSVFVSVGASPAEHIDPFPGDHRYRPDPLTMLVALRYYEAVHPEVFHVGLGDADEWGHRDNYPAYIAAVKMEDAFIGRLADVMDPQTTVIIATDHGRNEDFKGHGAASVSAARSFVMAFGGKIKPQGVACGERDITLTDIAPTIRRLVGLPPDHGEAAGRVIREIAP